MTKKTLAIAVPVYNEEHALEKNITLLHTFGTQQLQDISWTIVIADNGSTDATLRIARHLEKKLSNIRTMHLDTPGRGLAIRSVWMTAPADLLAYMDIDLSTSLKNFPALMKALQNQYDLAVGSRLLPQSHVHGRSLFREILSRGYMGLVRFLLETRVTDAQCGFKAINKNAAQKILPHIKNTHWFFDTELLVIAEKLGYKIYEEPVQWEDDPSSSVNIFHTIIEDFLGIIRLKVDMPWKKISMYERT